MALACANCPSAWSSAARSEEHTSELQSPCNLVCRLLLEKKKNDTCASASAKCSGPERQRKMNTSDARRTCLQSGDASLYGGTHNGKASDRMNSLLQLTQR